MYKPIHQIHCRLWKECNNKCEFCYQRHMPKNHIWETPCAESLFKNGKILNNVVDSIIDKNEFSPATSITLVGGELFHRADMKELYEGFEFIIDSISKFVPKIGKKATVIFTNLLYKDLSLLYHVLEKMRDKGLTLIISYDPVGRFLSDKDFYLFENNIKKLYKYNDRISIRTNLCQPFVNLFLTNPNCKEIKLFKELYSIFSIDFGTFRYNPFMPDKFKRMNKEDLVPFLHIMHKHFPKTFFINLIVRNSVHYSYENFIIIQNGAIFDNETKLQLPSSYTLNKCINCCFYNSCNIQYLAAECYNSQNIEEECFLVSAFKEMGIEKF